MVILVMNLPVLHSLLLASCYNHPLPVLISHKITRWSTRITFWLKKSVTLCHFFSCHCVNAETFSSCSQFIVCRPLLLWNKDLFRPYFVNEVHICVSIEPSLVQDVESLRRVSAPGWVNGRYSNNLLSRRKPSLFKKLAISRNKQLWQIAVWMKFEQFQRFFRK